MKLQLYKTLIATISISIVLFFINKIILQSEFFYTNFRLFSTTLEFVYFILTLFSVLILSTSIVVNSKNKDVVGMTFMLMTTVKVGVLYFVFSKIVPSSNENSVERINFFIVFILFLAMETLITIRLLNKKQ
ncbi:hypothetical protein [Flavobacterium sp.]|uniref:hypothetical protein n=1 Tax=Flavobacterium sp. TaxID=239 RepID=UPI0037530004